VCHAPAPRGAKGRAARSFRLGARASPRRDPSYHRRARARSDEAQRGPHQLQPRQSRRLQGTRETAESREAQRNPGRVRSRAPAAFFAALEGAQSHHHATLLLGRQAAIYAAHARPRLPDHGAVHRGQAAAEPGGPTAAILGAHAMTTPEGLFNPAHYASARLPVLEAETLPPWCYTSQRFYDREVERMFKTSWNFIGRADELPKAGDYAAYDLVGEPLLMVRDRAGTLRAFANSCRHRGTRLLDGTGNCRGIVCPYHGWAYGLNGDLVGAAGMEETHGFDKRAYGLRPIRLETWDGFVFVNFSAEAGSLRDYLGDLRETLASYGLSDMVCVRRREYDLACNWK